MSAQHNADTRRNEDMNRSVIDLASDQHQFPPIIHPKGFMHAPIHHVNRKVNADACCIVGMTNIDPTYHIHLKDRKKRGERGKDTKKRAGRKCKNCVKFEGSNSSKCLGRSHRGFVNTTMKMVPPLEGG